MHILNLSRLTHREGIHLLGVIIGFLYWGSAEFLFYQNRLFILKYNKQAVIYSCDRLDKPMTFSGSNLYHIKRIKS